jgi:hypothetical protein
LIGWEVWSLIAGFASSQANSYCFHKYRIYIWSSRFLSAVARFEWLVRTRIVTSDPVVLHCRSLISSSSAFGNSGRAADLGAHRPADGYYNHSAGKSFGNNKDYGPSFGNSNRRGSNPREDGNCNGSGFTHRRPDARGSAIPDPVFSQWQPSERIRRLQNEQVCSISVILLSQRFKEKQCC